MDGPRSLFRPEALAHQRDLTRRADLLRIDPSANRWVYQLLCAAFLMAILFVVIGRLHEYASGPAIIHLEGRATLTAPRTAMVTHIEVAPGDTVEEGEVVVRFDAFEEAAELEAVTRELEDQLTKLLQRPDDSMAREAVVSLRTRRDLAQMRLEQRTLRAPRRGTVGDVRVREGQLVEAGLSLLELYEPSSAVTVTALLPGRYRPFLAAGDRLRFEVDGFHRRAHEVTLTSVGDQIVGPTEASRYLGKDLADAFAIDGPVVLVRALLPVGSFEADGQRFQFAHGMYGMAEVVVRTEPVAFVFVPTLKQWVERVRPDRWIELAAQGLADGR